MFDACEHSAQRPCLCMTSVAEIGFVTCVEVQACDVWSFNDESSLPVLMDKVYTQIPPKGASIMDITSQGLWPLENI